jgi:hypothetical protein
MRMRVPGNVIVLLTASSALWAQNNAALPDRFQSPSSAPDVRRILEVSVAATQRHWRAWLLYSYLERDENRRLDTAGHVKSEEMDVSRAILVNGIQFDQLVERNGHPPSAAEEQKQNLEIEKLQRLTPEQRAEQLRKEEEENTSMIGEVPRAFDFQLAGDEVVNGRPAWILQATSHPGYQAQGKYGKMFSKVAGRLWVDKEDFAWIKVDGYVIQPFSMGLFLARVLRGSHITMEQTHVDEGLWLPQHIEVRAAAKILFIKSLVIDRVLTYSEYSPPAGVVPETVVPVLPSARK